MPEPQPDPLEEKILKRIPLEVIGFAAFIALPVGLIFGALAGLFFFAGGVFAAVGFLSLKSSLARVLARDKARALRSGILLYLLRFVLILGVFFLIILVYPKRLLAFAAGFSTVIPGISGRSGRGPRPHEDNGRSRTHSRRSSSSSTSSSAARSPPCSRSSASRSRTRPIASPTTS